MTAAPWPQLDAAAVERLAGLPLRGLRREYPNQISHVLAGPQDVRSPREQHPAFYGCYDWHSAVHGIWLLARCVRQQPDAPWVPDALDLLDEHLTAERLGAERAYLEAPGRSAFERPYGWAWVMALAEALSGWPRAQAWAAALEPVVQVVCAGALAYFERLTYPVRAGTHANTAFALGLMRRAALARGDRPLADALAAAARRFFAADRDYPVAYEPGGEDFLSGALTEAALMVEVLPAPEAEAWLAAFLPSLGPLAQPARVSDRADPKIAHLDGLNLSRAWCLRRLAAAMAAGPRRDAWLDAARRHLEAGLPAVTSGHYEGEHWLATFALLALDL